MRYKAYRESFRRCFWTLCLALDDKCELIINYQLILMKMENKNNTVWGKILKVAITVLTALATVFGIQACS